MHVFRTRPVLYLLLFLLSFNFSFANHRYVNINNPTPGAGTSWATAYTDLNLAAATLSIFDTIWVAQGTYKPTGVGRSATFLFQSGSVCGGFNGTETSFSQRDPKVNITILSGDIGVAGDASDNCYHVVTLHNFNGSSILDGFTIRDGNANAGYPGSTAMQPDNSGGGVLDLGNTAGDISYTGIGHDIITNNFAVYGGGFCAYGDGQGNTTLTTLTFGLITTSQFDNNTAVVMGGAMAILTMNQDWGNTDVFNCIFTNNNCTNAQGSVMACYVNDAYTGGMHCSLDNCTLYNNGSPVIYNQQVTGVSNVEVENDIVWKSGAAYPGPLITGNNVPSFDNSDVYLSTALVGGGNLDVDPQFVNPAGNDFHVAHCSPVVDAGYALFEVKKDIDGAVRPQGNGQDMGVYESAKPLPPAPPAADSTWCQFATSNPLTATPDPGNTLVWYTTPTGGIGSATAPTPPTTVATSIYYYASQADALGCEGPRTLVKAIIKSGAAMPTAPNVTYCLNDVATALTATPLAGSTLLWYTASSGGAGSTTAPVPVTTASGVTTYYVTQTPAAGCESGRKAITVTINGASAAPTATSPSYCQNATASALTATGSNLKWYLNSSGGSSVPAPVPSTATVGVTTYYVTQTPAASCESTRLPVTVTINGPSADPTATSPTYCQNAAASALTATGSNIKWYLNSAGGSSVPAPVPSTAAVGVTTYYVTQTPAASCESNRLPVTVTVSGPPAAPGTSPVNYCENAAAVPLTATGSGLLWYTASAGGIGNATAPTPSTTAAGSTTYYVSQTIGCESPRASIVVTVGAPPAAPVVASTAYCQNDVPVALTATGTNLLWYTSAAGGIGSTVAPTPSTTTAGSFSYYVSQTSGCESPRAVATITVNPNPAADFSWSPACAGASSNISAISTTPAANNYTWNFGANATAKGTGAGPYQVIWNTGGSYTVTLTATTGTCQSQATHNVTVYALPQVNVSAVTGTLCSGNTVTLNANGASTYLWSPATGLSDATSSTPVATFTSDIIYTVTGTDNNGCINTAQVELKPSANCQVTTPNLGYNIPDAFTPNGDGKNDLFRVVTGDTPQSFRMMIFNRYGQKVFETSNVSAGWDGTIGGNQSGTGAYVYTIVIKTSAGTTIEKKGTVLLIR